VCDSIVLHTTLSNARSSRVSESSIIKASLLTLLVRDGTLYFGTLLLMNCVQIALWVTNIFPHFATFIQPVSSIVVSRFILTLRKIYLSSSRPSFIHAQYTLPSQLTSVRFTTTEGDGFTARSRRLSTAEEPSSERPLGSVDTTPTRTSISRL